jgi:hypothetical protein
LVILLELNGLSGLLLKLGGLGILPEFLGFLFFGILPEVSFLGVR